MNRSHGHQGSTAGGISDKLPTIIFAEKNFSSGWRCLREQYPEADAVIAA